MSIISSTIHLHDLGVKMFICLKRVYKTHRMIENIVPRVSFCANDCNGHKDGNLNWHFLD